MAASKLGPIISINIDGKYSTLIQLEPTITQYMPEAVFIQDLPYLSIKRLKQAIAHIAHGYIMVAQTRPDMTRFKRYHVILVRQPGPPTQQVELVTQIIASNEATNKQASTLMISTRLGHNRLSRFILASIYVRPRAKWDEFKQCLDLIETTARDSKEGLSKLILMGDFNATHINWAPMDEITYLDEQQTGTANLLPSTYYNTKINRGRAITSFYTRNKLILLNNKDEGPTYYNKANGASAYIDIALVGSRSCRIWRQYNKPIEISETTQHRAIMIGPNDSVGNITFSRRYYYKYNDIRAEHFLALKSDTVALMFGSWYEMSHDGAMVNMNKLSDKLYECLANIQALIKKHSNLTKVNLARPSNNRNNQMKRLINKTATLDNQIKRLRQVNLHLKTTVNQRRSRQQQYDRRQQLKQTIKKRNKFRSKLINLMNHKKIQLRQQQQLLQTTATATNEDEQQRLWRNINLATEVLDPNNEFVAQEGITQSELDKLAKKHFPRKLRQHFNYVNEERASKPYLDTSINLTAEEIITAFRELRNKTYTGPEGVKFQVFNKAIEFIPDILATICILSFKTCSIPDCCSLTSGTLIPKKTAGKYRIVHVSTPLAALLEQIALHRFEYALEHMGLFNRLQFGFTAQRSRHDLITRVLELILKGRRENHDAPVRTVHRKPTKSTIISFDIEGAFDNVCHDRLIEKLDYKLGPHKVKYWLINFILNQQISLRYNKSTLKSVSRWIHQGVPQGSSLGPILWNFTINNIDQSINIPKKLELLSYADDLFMVHNQNDKKTLQSKINDLTRQLKHFGLQINVDKSCVLTVSGKAVDKAESAYSLGGQLIKSVRTLNILGVPITRRLKLDTNYKELKDKIFKNCQKLNTISQLSIIKTNAEWQTLLESYLYSLTQINLAPILAIDKNGREYIDNLHCRMLKFIFNWPNNVANKTVRLITNCRLTHTEIHKIIALRLSGEHKQGYKLLLTILKHNRMDSLKAPVLRRLKIGKLKELTQRSYDRKYANPDKMMNLPDTATTYPKVPRNRHFPNLYNKPIWVITELNNKSIFTELLQGTVIQSHSFTNTLYPISYFNTMSGVWTMVKNQMTHDKNIVFTQNNALIQALANNRNHDWRVIDLRESLKEQNWHIHAISNREMGQLQEHIRNLLNNPEGGYFIPHITVTNPDITDYKWNNHIHKQYQHKVREESIDNHTYTTRFTCGKHEEWLNITPNWVKGPTMLMLTGLFKTNSGKLDISKQSIYTNMNNQGQEMVLQQCSCIRPQHYTVLTHKILECQRNAQIRRDLIQTATRYGINILPPNSEQDRVTIRKEDIDILFKDHRTRYILLRYMTNCML